MLEAYSISLKRCNLICHTLTSPERLEEDTIGEYFPDISALNEHLTPKTVCFYYFYREEILTDRVSVPRVKDV